MGYRHAEWEQAAKHTKNWCDTKLQHIPPNTEFIRPDNVLQRPLKKDKSHNTILQVKNQDTISAALEAINTGLCSKPLVLNMASDIAPGGGWLSGCAAQEENLFIRTSLCRQYKRPKEYLKRKKFLGPLDIAYTPNVLVLKDENFNMLEESDRVYLDFVACAALRRPQLNKHGQMSEKNLELARKKIYQILQLANDKGHDAVILGAMGCGAFKNPPEQIAELFKDVLETHFRHHVFRLVKFAILSRKGANTITNTQNSNFDIFRNTLSKKWWREIPEESYSDLDESSDILDDVSDDDSDDGSWRDIVFKKTVSLL
uniref:Microbial-type PARG catalytic domain-containing protein n=1 Tax=viral metagenome TaxID=1070528 RepID=A0A6C0CKC9_9ZZZZ